MCGHFQPCTPAQTHSGSSRSAGAVSHAAPPRLWWHFSGFRPILVPLDLQSVEKPFQHVRMSSCPGNVGNWSVSPQIVSDLSPRSTWRRFPLFQAPGKLENCRPHLFDPTGSNIRSKPPSGSKKNVCFDPIPDRNHIHLTWIEKMPTVIPCYRAPRKAGNTPSQILGKNPTHSEARKTDFQHCRGKSSCERAERDFFNLTANPAA